MLRKLNSVAVKLSLLSSLFVLGVIGLMAERILQESRRAFVAEMSVRAEFFARACREAIFPKVDPFQLHFHVAELLREKGVVYAQVSDLNGKVLSHSNPALIGETDGSPEGHRALRGSQTLLQRYRSRVDRREYYDISAPVTLRERRVGTIRMGFTEDSLEQALAAAKRHILVLAVLAILGAVLGTVLIVNWIMRPLPLLASAAEEIGRGNRTVRVEWKSRDEIGVLAGAFNAMAESNARAFSLLTEEMKKFQTVFTQAGEGIVWTDAAGAILLINPSARQLLGFVDRPPNDLGEAFAHFEIKPPLGELAGMRTHSLQCEFHRRNTPKALILAGACERLAGETSSTATGLLLVFRDVTLERREETLSRGVLSLISHKLRTPLTVALGFQELLEHGEEGRGFTDFQKKSLAHMRAQTEKLRYLIEKLLIFTTVQNPETVPLETALCLPKEIAERAVRGLAPWLEEEKVQVAYAPESLMKLQPLLADSRHLTEALKNLIENAVKFNRKTPKGEKKARIEIARIDRGLRFSVVDNGPGIPPEEHPKLFRRFYQIDEDFTGQIEGIGLGLAYVKNVAQAHGGTAGLESKLGEGSTFYFDIPYRERA
ncbi:MAG: HAMP domain-containing protein [Elusimicrobia bacterium]|nr:HAMP domain-containing protein [Elusimicrobiota bacterium]